MNLFPSRRSVVATVLFLACGASAPACAATITVTSNADIGPGTLRQAVTDAHSGDTINFNLAWPATIAIISPPLYLTKNLTIAGPGADKLFFDGNMAGNPVFQNHFLLHFRFVSFRESLVAEDFACSA